MEGAPVAEGSVAAGRSAEPDPLAPPHPDWLRHDLLVGGPAGDVAAFRDSAAGAGVIPWANPDLEVVEEDHVLALIRVVHTMQPPQQRNGVNRHVLTIDREIERKDCHGNREPRRAAGQR